MTDYVYSSVEMKYPGGRCFCRMPGLKNNIVSWDFKGYYSSLMRTFNIGIDTLMLTKDLRAIPRKKRPYVPLVLSPYTYVNQKQLDKFAERLLDEGYDITYTKEPIEGYNLKIEVPVVSVEMSKDKVKEFYIHTQNIIDDLWKDCQNYMTIGKEGFQGFFFKFKKVKIKNGYKVHIGMPNQCYFRQDFDSIIRIALELTASERNKWKKVKKELEIEDEKDSTKWLMAESNQLAYKLLGNVMYGQMGNVFARIYHPACAMSITLGGQIATEWTRLFFTKVNRPVWYMDTDSNYVFNPDYSKEEQKEFIKYFDETYHKNLWKYYNRIFGVQIKDNCIILEREKTWARMMFLSKKRYAGRVIESDGVACDKFVTRGIELRRTGTIKFAKDFQSKYYEMIFQDEVPDVKEFITLVEEHYEKFFNMDFSTPEQIEEVTKRMSIKKSVNEYAEDSKLCQVQLFKRCIEDGEELPIGSMLEYVLLKISDKQKKNYAETVERFDNSMLIHKDHYWNKEIYNPIFKQLLRLFPEEDWGKYDNENKRMCDKKYLAQTKRLVKKKLCDKIRTVEIIRDYKRFSKHQSIDLLNQCKDKWKNDESVELVKLIDESLEYYVTNKYLEVDEDGKA